MKKKREPKTWRPRYLESQDVKVQLQDYYFSTFMSDRRAGINVDDYQVEDPACFWIDYEHVYLRTNWSMWSTISLSSPEQVVAICNSHYCRVIYSARNEVCECAAPVYRIAELPEELFNEDVGDKEEEQQSDKSTRNKREYQRCLDKIKQIVDDNASMDLTVFPNYKLEGNSVAVVIANDGHALLMDFLPENKDFDFIPPNGDNRHELISSCLKNEISLDFIEKLKDVQKELSALEPDAIIDVGFLANTKTMAMFRLRCAMIASEDSGMYSELISDFKLFTYEDLNLELISIFL